MLRALPLLAAGLGGSCICLDFGGGSSSSWDAQFGRAFADLERDLAHVAAIERMLVLPPGARAERTQQLADALEAFFADRSEANAIWVGRRLAYLGLFESSVAWYQVRAFEFPESHRLLRHLGHRHITLRDPARAIDALEHAREFAADDANESEPDGQPNAAGVPTSSTHGNIDYHLALAYYLARDFEAAAEAWRRCVEQWAMNDDARVAAGHWLATTLRRLGREEELAALVEALPAEPAVIENFAYRDLVDLHAGRRTAEELEAALAGAPLDATRAYGLARYLFDRGDTERGTAWLRRVAEEGDFASFGRIAAEADLGLPSPTFRGSWTWPSALAPPPPGDAP